MMRMLRKIIVHVCICKIVKQNILAGNDKERQISCERKVGESRYLGLLLLGEENSPGSLHPHVPLVHHVPEHGVDGGTYHTLNDKDPDPTGTYRIR